MSKSPAQTLRYLTASTLDEGVLGLATAGGRTAAGPSSNPSFFTGFLERPQIAAAGLTAVGAVARARYHQPQLASLRDPVVTCDGDRIRFESFSSCCGVYARLDVLSESLDGQSLDRGTTNVDFNDSMRVALARVGARDPLRLTVGAEEMSVATMDDSVVEKKVPLPQRWLRGFAEVQAICAPFDPRAELPASEATRFLRSLPRGREGSAPVWFAAAGRGLKRTARPVPGAVCLAAPRRLEALQPLLRFARSLRAYGPAVTASSPPSASVWELELPGMRLSLALSPQQSRGFSGEGAVLEALAADETEADAETIGELLDFQPYIDVDHLSQRSGLEVGRVKSALAQLGTAGRVGYDLAEAAYFHRELPYDSADVEQLNPRLRGARKLAEAGSVRFEGTTARVRSGEEEYRVRLDETGAPQACTCPWDVKRQAGRGKCKHMLAVQMTVGSDQDGAPRADIRTPASEQASPSR